MSGIEHQMGAAKQIDFDFSGVSEIPEKVFNAYSQKEKALFRQARRDLDTGVLKDENIRHKVEMFEEQERKFWSSEDDASPFGDDQPYKRRG
ncbi:MAG: hypothetical protein WAV15_00420 [Minisyncoccia bacterium]